MSCEWALYECIFAHIICILIVCVQIFSLHPISTTLLKIYLENGSLERQRECRGRIRRRSFASVDSVQGKMHLFKRTLLKIRRKIITIAQGSLFYSPLCPWVKSTMECQGLFPFFLPHFFCFSSKVSPKWFDVHGSVALP